MTYTYEIEELDGSFRKCTHQAVIYRDGNKVSTHKTRKGKATAEAEAKRTIEFYQRQDKKDRAAA